MRFLTDTYGARVVVLSISDFLHILISHIHKGMEHLFHDYIHPAYTTAHATFTDQWNNVVISTQDLMRDKFTLGCILAILIASSTAIWHIWVDPGQNEE